MKKIWAYSCELQKTTTGRMHLQKPILGIIEGHNFIPIGKFGDPLYSKKVNKFTRKYADTYEEAKEEYNKKIDELINYYETQINRLKDAKE